jgi:hypothetical protein
LRHSSFDAPHPYSSPNVIAPKHSSETLNPLLPNRLYFIEISFLIYNKNSPVSS